MLFGHQTYARRSAAFLSASFLVISTLKTEGLQFWFSIPGPPPCIFTFRFSHLADAFIQSDLKLGVHKAINLEEANIQRKCQ